MSHRNNCLRLSGLPFCLDLRVPLILFASAPVVAVFFHDSRLVGLTIATAPSLVAASLGSIPTALLNRRIAFRALALLDAVMALSVFVTAIVERLVGCSVPGP